MSKKSEHENKLYPPCKAVYSEDRTEVRLDGCTYTLADREDWGPREVPLDWQKVMLHCRVWSIEHLGHDPWPEEDKKMKEWRANQEENSIQNLDAQVSLADDQEPT